MIARAKGLPSVELKVEKNAAHIFTDSIESANIGVIMCEKKTAQIEKKYIIIIIACATT